MVLSRSALLTSKLLCCLVPPFPAPGPAERTGGESWSRIFAAHHSGTYNNQWMVVNRDRYGDGRAHPPHQQRLLQSPAQQPCTASLLSSLNLQPAAFLGAAGSAPAQ